MYRAGLILAGLIGGVVAFGGSSLATYNVTTLGRTPGNLLPRPSHSKGKPSV